MRISKALCTRSLALAALPMIAGCVSLGSEPPPSLLTLTPSAMAPADVPVTASEAPVISLTEFEAPQRLNVTRVPVQVSDSEIAYLKDAGWVEKPARLLRRLIAETMRSQSKRVVFDAEMPGMTGAVKVSGVLREFGFDARGGGELGIVTVRFDAVRRGEDGSVTAQRFEARIEGVAPEAQPVGAALNQAANDVAGQIASWAG